MRKVERKEETGETEEAKGRREKCPKEKSSLDENGPKFPGQRFDEQKPAECCVTCVPRRFWMLRWRGQGKHREASTVSEVSADIRQIVTHRDRLELRAVLVSLAEDRSRVSVFEFSSFLSFWPIFYPPPPSSSLSISLSLFHHLFLPRLSLPFLSRSSTGSRRVFANGSKLRPPAHPRDNTALRRCVAQSDNSFGTEFSRSYAVTTCLAKGQSPAVYCRVACRQLIKHDRLSSDRR